MFEFNLCYDPYQTLLSDLCCMEQLEVDIVISLWCKIHFYDSIRFFFTHLSGVALLHISFYFLLGPPQVLAPFLDHPESHLKIHSLHLIEPLYPQRFPLLWGSKGSIELAAELDIKTRSGSSCLLIFLLRAPSSVSQMQ